MLAKVAGIDVRDSNGQTVVVLKGKTGAGKTVELALPAHGIGAILSEAERRVDAYNAQKNRTGPNQYYPSVVAAGAPCDVGSVISTGTEKVALIVRKGLRDEQTLWFDPSDALALAIELQREALRLQSEQGPKRPN